MDQFLMLTPRGGPGEFSPLFFMMISARITGQMQQVVGAYDWMARLRLGVTVTA
jgi:hypothetical protein